MCFDMQTSQPPVHTSTHLLLSGSCILQSGTGTLCPKSHQGRYQTTRGHPCIPELSRSFKRSNPILAQGTYPASPMKTTRNARSVFPLCSFHPLNDPGALPRGPACHDTHPLLLGTISDKPPFHWQPPFDLLASPNQKKKKNHSPRYTF